MGCLLFVTLDNGLKRNTSLSQGASRQRIFGGRVEATKHSTLNLPTSSHESSEGLINQGDPETFCYLPRKCLPGTTISTTWSKILEVDSQEKVITAHMQLDVFVRFDTSEKNETVSPP